jgi:hypothetical protein
VNQYSQYGTEKLPIKQEEGEKYNKNGIYCINLNIVSEIEYTLDKLKEISKQYT